MAKKLLILICISLGLGILTKNIGLTFQQALSVSIFSASITGTLFFWDFRLGFVFLGTSILLITRTTDIEHVIKFASLDVILFLVGMMVLVGLLKETGFFTWLINLILHIKNLTAQRFVVILCAVSAMLAGAVDEVTSILFMVALIFEFCDQFEADPVPFLIISVFATNIGSASTVLGNPIGILIATKAGLTFEDFIIKALPLAVLCLIVTILIVSIWYRKSIRQLDVNIKKRSDKKIASAICAPMSKELKISMAIFGVTLIFISLHHRLELLLGLMPNTILLTMPLLSSGCVMIWRKGKARKHIEHDVEWWTLLFFLLLFAQAGTLKYTGATDVLARHLAQLTNNSMAFLTGIILWISAIGSAVLDNVVLVAALIPVVQSFNISSAGQQALWWALLFGGCLGGNITLVGSTANIVALGMLEKQKNIHMTFMRWFWAGLTVGIITTVVVWVVLLVVPFYH